MKYYAYRISKYNTRYYDEFGIYTKNEWTSKSDIGKAFDNRILDASEYLLVENKYVDAVQYLLQEFGIVELIVSKLENNSFPIEDEIECLTDLELFECIDGINEGTIISKKNVENIIRAMLRDYIWCELYSKEKHFILSVGYDYYIHLICEELTETQKNQISAMGLFVEVWKHEPDTNGQFC